MIVPEYKPETYSDFTDAKTRDQMEKALAKVEGEFGKTYPLVIGGKRVKAGETFTSTNPARPSQVIGHFQKATPELANQAVDAALEAFKTWSQLSGRQRGGVLLRAAALLKRRRFDMNAAMVLEVGKNWAEADGDTAEAIDFLEFYAREMIRLAAPHPLTPLPGEALDLKYIPMGVAAVIPPWNFPCAILAGMTTAAMVTGNTVVMKPASDSPLVGWKVFEILEDAGMPPGVVNYLSGPGAIAGQTLVEHPKVRMISFTGSMAVGKALNVAAAEVRPGQIWLKRVVAEMGGKDFTVVMEDGDFDAAVAGVYAGFTGYQGQKCSACSRAIVHRDIYDRFITALVERTKNTSIGEPKKAGTYLGPMINEGAMKKALKYVAIGQEEGGRLVAGGERAPGEGFFLQPTIIADVKPNDRLAQEEVFAPVLAVIPVDSYEEAIEVANGTIYGLTGSIFTSNPHRIAQAKRDLHVGNLYINRKCTGALVDVHPFGGFNMSGTDSKAGGRDYLQLFLQAKSVAEKINY